MKARASAVIAAVGSSGGGGRTLQTATSEPPFHFRECDGRILIAASAAAPVGGDELSMEIDVLPGARADIGTVASTIVLPGPTGAPSSMATHCTVGDGGHLDWYGEPTVSVTGSDHIVSTTVDLAAAATCRIVEEVSLGRSGETSGRLRLVLRIERAGGVLVHHDELFGPDVPGAGSAVSVGPARHVLSAVLVGVDAGAPRSLIDGHCRLAWLPVTTDAAVVLAVGADRPTVTAAVATLAPELGC